MIKKVIIFFGFLLLLSSCAFQTGTMSSSGMFCDNCVKFTGDDGSDFQNFRSFLIRNNVEIKKTDYDNRGIVILWNNSRLKGKENVPKFPIILKPRYLNNNEFGIQTGHITFLFYQLVKEKYKYTTHLSKLISKLNSQYDMYTFSLDDEQDIIISFYLPFKSELQWAQFRDFLDSSFLTLTVLILNDDELSKMIK